MGSPYPDFNPALSNRLKLLPHGSGCGIRTHEGFRRRLMRPHTLTARKTR